MSGRWCDVGTTATSETASYRKTIADPVEIAAITMRAVAAALTEDIADVLEELGLEAVVAKVNAQRAGTVECHHHKLEKKGSRRSKTTVRVRHRYLRIRLLPSTMF
jgi:L-amino acid N-acyltransferase YncA